ncbi:WecB/TagA/CpsF family glycosyltransferase [Candidatus Falkowbacteria bacterium]|nr:WecB/TagA/CpsF family glycosyltransferase [Candidatus Falkowbacteria bacterium]NCT55029.1 WecB/TagA/CpsF family glycosyltransferase [Candidatus Falkowbacteria bacterium]
MAFVLGIKISDYKTRELDNKLEEFLNSNESRYLVTPNPEMILLAHKDEELFYILNKADLAPADGFGLRLAGFLEGKKISIISGSDLTPKLLARAEKLKEKVFIANWRDGLSKKFDLELALKEKYPELIFLVLDLDRSPSLNPEILAQINNFSPKIMFSTSGSPYQEKFIFHNYKKITSLRLALPVGGSFDFITEKLQRAPLTFRRLGLEWLWRLILQPKRLKRIYRAVFVFSFKVLSAYLKHYFYRPNVACLLYKKTGDGVNNEKFILIVEREDEPGHWQIPQGGTDGESLAVAGRRELNEELNTDNFKIKATYKNLFKYSFPPTVIESDRLKFSYKFEYKGQKQGLLIAEFKGDDEEVKINHWEHLNFKWVKEGDFLEVINERRKKSGKIFLEKLRLIKD